MEHNHRINVCILLGIILVLQYMLGTPPPNSNKISEKFTNSFSSLYDNPDARKDQPHITYNQLEKDQYNLHEDCMFNSDCVLPANNVSFFEYDKPVIVPPKFLSSEFIANDTSKPILSQKQKHLNNLKKQYKNVFHKKSVESLNPTKLNIETINKNIGSSHNLSCNTINRPVPHLDKLHNHNKTIYNNLLDNLETVKQV